MSHSDPSSPLKARSSKAQASKAQSSKAQSSKELSSKALSGADVALQRASIAAQALARRTGTPCWVRRDGRLVDLAGSSPPEPSGAGPRKKQKGP